MQQSVDVAEGEYEIAVTFSDAVGTVTTSGSRASAITGASVFATFESQDVPEIAAGQFADLPSSPGDVVVRVRVSIPEATTLFVTADISATSTADGRGNSASATASTSAISILAERIG